MALEIFLRIDGVTGGSRNFHHQGWADVLSWGWALERADAPAADRAAGDLRMHEITVTKAVGVDSAALMQLCATGSVAAAAEIEVIPQVGKREAQQKYLSLRLGEVRVKSIRTGGSSEDSQFHETVTLSFKRICFEYMRYADANASGGAGEGVAHAFDWSAEPA